jgi:UDP-N-acetylmuramoyl-L-alanyl-D-glutamate--2,6-diaminopimelate ligase
MAEVAGRLSNFVVLTSDNPRTEDPESILDEVEEGLEDGCEYVRVADRKKAIEDAVSRAEEDDIILIAGKGHEDYQIIGTEKIHFDDREVVGEAIIQLMTEKG